MRLEHDFEVALPPEEVWTFLLDIERVAPCLPGAETISRRSDDSYDAAVKIKMGPMRMHYVGHLTIAEADVISHRAALTAEATEARGQGTASAAITMQLSPKGGATHVGVMTDLKLTGRVARMGHGLVEQAADEMLKDFVTCLSAKAAESRPGDIVTAGSLSNPDAAELARPPTPRPINPIGLLVRILRGRLRRWLAGPPGA